MSAARFIEDAERCDRMAAIMLAPAQREAYVEMARMWRKLANATDNHLQRVAAWERRSGIGSPEAASKPAFQSADGESATTAG